MLKDVPRGSQNGRRLKMSHAAAMKGRRSEMSHAAAMKGYDNDLNTKPLREETYLNGKFPVRFVKNAFVRLSTFTRECWDSLHLLN
mgnify:CR=1 FL=1